MGAALPVAIGLQVAGTALSAEAGKANAAATEGYYRFLAGQSDKNAELTELAGQRQARGIQDAAAGTYGQHLRAKKQFLGAQRAAGAAAGVSGATAEDLARDTEDKAALDEMAIRFNADSSSDEVLRQAGLTAFNQRSEADGYRMSADEAKRAGKINYLTTLIGGASSVAGTMAMAGRGPSGPAQTPGRGAYLPPKLSLLPPAGTTRRPY